MAFTDEDKTVYVKELYDELQKQDEKSCKEILLCLIEQVAITAYEEMYEEMCEECKEALKKKYIVEEAL